MAKNRGGRFVVSQLADGRFVAAASSAPYFCFRAESEEAVLAKVKRAVEYCGSRTLKHPEISIKRVTEQVITSVDGPAYELSDMLEAA